MIFYFEHFEQMSMQFKSDIHYSTYSEMACKIGIWHQIRHWVTQVTHSQLLYLRGKTREKNKFVVRKPRISVHAGPCSVLPPCLY
jgi:hypothetical protein